MPPCSCSCSMLVPEWSSSSDFGEEKERPLRGAGKIAMQRGWNGNAMMCVGVAVSHAVGLSMQLILD